MKENLYIILTHHKEDDDLEIQYATFNLKRFIKECEDYGVEDLDEQQIKSSPKPEITREYYWDHWVILYRFEVETPYHRLYALCSNGDEQCWQAKIEGIYHTKKEVKKALSYEIDTDDLDDSPEYKEQFDEFGPDRDYWEPDSTIWRCLRITGITR